MKSWPLRAERTNATLTDANVLLDVVTDDPVWVAWSLAALAEAALAGPIFVNDIAYAEISTRYATIEQLDEMLAGARIRIAPIPTPALFLAGKAFLRYRRAGGVRTGVLPDFFIGAHAAIEGWPLLTRDARRYRTYFPTLRVIAPDA
jgi:predicted nucleic acid-binding protein